MGEQERDEPESRCRSSHQDGAQAAFRSLPASLLRIEPKRPEVVEAGDQNQSVENRDAEERDEANRCRNRKIFAGQAERDDSADQRKRYVHEDQDCLPRGP